MTEIRANEFDDYQYPEPLTEETTESKRKLEEVMTRIRALVKKHHEENET